MADQTEFVATRALGTIKKEIIENTRKHRDSYSGRDAKYQHALGGAQCMNEMNYLDC